MIKAIFISVRTGSTRLPKKALKKIRGKATIEYLIDRLKESTKADLIVLCTTKLKEDNILCNIAEKNGINFFRGSAPDKLKRWLDATLQYNVDFFVNVDGDDLFFDAGLADLCFERYEASQIDFIDGQGLYNDVYGITACALKKVCELKDNSDTEFILPYFKQGAQSGLFKISKLNNTPEKYKKQNIRMTLDYEEDYIFFSTVINYFIDSNMAMSFENILSYLHNNPDIKEINWHREQDWKLNQNNIINNLKVN